MNKLFSILIICLLCFSGLLIIAPIEVKATTYLSDTFESFPNSWSYGNATYSLGRTAEQFHGGSYSWFFNTTVATQYGYAYKACSITAMTFHVSCVIYVSSAVTGINDPFIGLWSGSAYVIRASINCSGGAYYITNEYSSGNYENVTLIYANTWYHVDLYASRTTGKIHYYLDSVKVGTDWTLETNASSATYYLGDANAASFYGKYFFDDLSVDDAAEPSPSDTEAPKYSNIGYNTTYAGQACKFSSLWTDNVSLSGYIFGTNNSGSFTNDTWAAFASSNSSWANVTKTLTATVGTTVQFQWWANDTSNNWNNTGLQSLTVTTPAFSISWTYDGLRNFDGFVFYNETKVIVNGTAFNATGYSVYKFQAYTQVRSFGNVFNTWIVNGSRLNLTEAEYVSGNYINPLFVTANASYTIVAEFQEQVMIVPRCTVVPVTIQPNQNITLDANLSIAVCGINGLYIDWGDGTRTPMGGIPYYYIGGGSVPLIQHNYTVVGVFNITLTVEDMFYYQVSWTFYSVNVVEDTSWYIAPGFILGLICFMAVGFVFVKKRRD